MKKNHISLLLLLLIAGCQIDIARHMQRAELFFGLSMHDGSTISDAVWQGFVDDTITPRFPDGFTILDGTGQWRDSSGKITHEKSKILVVLAPDNGETIQKLNEIRAEYKKRFNQESVIRAGEDAWVAF